MLNLRNLFIGFGEAEFPEGKIIATNSIWNGSDSAKGIGKFLRIGITPYKRISFRWSVGNIAFNSISRNVWAKFSKRD